MSNPKARKTCNYCQKSLRSPFVLISDATWEDFEKIRLSTKPSASSGYCSLFCLWNDLKENLSTSEGQTIN